MATAQEILNRMRDALSMSDPEWDVSVGTPTYKILEAVALEIQTVFQGSTLHDYHFDIETKTGGQLDDFVSLFGIERLPAKRATGTVTFKRGTIADQDYDIPAGTQVIKPATAVSPPIYFQTVTAGTIQQGQTEVEVPIEAVVAGASGNVVAGAISLYSGNVAGVSQVNNENPTSDGRDAETDESLRRRWRVTVFRNLAGTEDQFLAIALDEDEVSRALVVGPSERVREQLEIQSVGVGGAEFVSQLNDVKYRFTAGSEFMGEDIGSPDEVLAIRDSDYTWDPSTGTVTILDQTDWPVGKTVDFEHEYTPQASRNDPANGIVHRVDIFVAGQDAERMIEEITMRTDAAHTFNTTAGDPMQNTKWLRTNETTNPTPGNYFMPLMHTPIVTIPENITVNHEAGGSTQYSKNVHYWLVRDVTLNRGSQRARDGIEWDAAAAPAANDNVVVDYTYNELVRTVDEQIKQFRLVGTDTLAHEANYRRLRFHLSIVFGETFTPSSETELVTNILTEWLEAKEFRDNVQISDMIDVVHNVQGVDNVRLTKSTDAGVTGNAYNILELAEDGTALTNHGSDIYLKSDEVPVLESVVVRVHGQNTF